MRRTAPSELTPLWGQRTRRAWGRFHWFVFSSVLVDLAFDFERRRPGGQRGVLRVGGEAGHAVHGVAEHRESELFARIVVSLRDEARQRANTADIRRAFGHRDRAARIEQVERVRGL